MVLPLIPIAAAVIGAGAGGALVSVFGTKPQTQQTTTSTSNIDRSVRTTSSHVYSPTSSYQYTRTSQLTNAPVYTYSPFIQISSPYASGSLRNDIGSSSAGTAQSVPTATQTPSVSIPTTENREGNPVNVAPEQKSVTDMTGLLLIGGVVVGAYLFLNQS